MFNERDKNLLYVTDQAIPTSSEEDLICCHRQKGRHSHRPILLPEVDSQRETRPATEELLWAGRPKRLPDDQVLRRQINFKQCTPANNIRIVFLISLEESIIAAMQSRETLCTAF